MPACNCGSFALFSRLVHQVDITQRVGISEGHLAKFRTYSAERAPRAEQIIGFFVRQTGVLYDFNFRAK